MINCSHCHSVYTCQADSACWCTDYPAILPIDTQQSCVCETCLKGMINEKITSIIQYFHQSGINQAITFKDLPVLQYYDYTIENGLWVFTAWYHLRRGYCCGNGCKNCPY